MAALRVSLLFLLLNLFQTVAAAVPVSDPQNSADEVVQRYSDVPLQAQLTILIAENQSANISIGFDPALGAKSGQDVPGSLFLCGCKDKTALLYLHICGEISLKLSSHKIAFTFHSFP